MEQPTQLHADQDEQLRRFWTRFEGLVGNQLCRLRVDGDPEEGFKSSPEASRQVSPVTKEKRRPPGCKQASLMRCVSPGGSSCSPCSQVSSDTSTLSVVSSPSRIEEQVFQYNVMPSFEQICSESVCLLRLSELGSQVDPPCYRQLGMSAYQKRSRAASEIGVENGGGDSSAPAQSSASSFNYTEDEDSATTTLEEATPVRCLTRRNASGNALNSSNDSQPLFGLPYVARAVEPLLSLTMVTLEEMSGLDGRPESFLRLDERRRECTRSMMGVYKQSLLLESQLHQYLNPGLVTSLNKRIAKATCQAESMVALIDKLKRESKMAATDPERLTEVKELSTKLKSLLARQKCEWQCVGRLKETLTMAREMKELLRFIARLSNTLEHNKTALGALQDRPPPYEVCSPGSGVTKPGLEYNNQPKALCNVDNSKSPAPSDPIGNVLISTEPKQADPIGNILISAEPRDDNDTVKEIKLRSEKDAELDSSNEKSDALDSWNKPIKMRVNSRGQSESPKRSTRLPQSDRSISANMDSSSSYCISDIRTMSSTGEPQIEPNVNTSHSREASPMCNKRPKTQEWSPGCQFIGDFTSGRRSSAASVPVPELTSGYLGCQKKKCKSDNGCVSPPRACPKKGSLLCKKAPRWGTNTCKTHWDGSTVKSTRLADIEGPREGSSCSCCSCEEQDSNYSRSCTRSHETLVSPASRSNQQKPTSRPASRARSRAASPANSASRKPSALKSGAGSRVQTPVGFRSPSENSLNQTGASDCEDKSKSCAEGESCGCEEESCGCDCDFAESDDDNVFIDIESEYPENQGGCGGEAFGRRRIKVKVKKSPPKVPERVNSNMSAKSKKSLASARSSRASVTSAGGVGSKSKKSLASARSSRASVTSAGEVGEVGEVLAKASNDLLSKDSNMRVQDESGSEEEEEEAEEEEPPANWWEWLMRYEFPFIGRLDEPWKIAVVVLLLLLLLYLLYSWLFGSCCCFYLPNPFFFLTNWLAGRVSYRHGGLAPV